VGYLENSREVVCNVCIFEKKLMAVKFTALVSKELRAEFNAAFAQYKNGINQINGVDTNLVRQRAAILVQNFFSQIREKVKLLQRQSMSKIQQSESLRELERIIEQSKEFLPDHTRNGDHFEREKKLFDEKIGKGRFAYLVKRQEFYQDLIQSLDKSSIKMKQTLEQSKEQMERVLKLRADEHEVRAKIDEIVGDCIDVDMANCRTNHTSPANNKPVYMNSAYSMQQQSPRSVGGDREVSSNMAQHASSGLNSSMQRNSMPTLNNSASQTFAQQHSPAEKHYTFGNNQ